MLKKNIINELRALIQQRGQVTSAQREYAMVEEQVMMQMYPVTKPHDEERSSHLRTLSSYTSDDALKLIIESNSNI